MIGWWERAVVNFGQDGLMTTCSEYLPYTVTVCPLSNKHKTNKTTRGGCAADGSWIVVFYKEQKAKHHPTKQRYPMPNSQSGSFFRGRTSMTDWFLAPHSKVIKLAKERATGCILFLGKWTKTSSNMCTFKTFRYSTLTRVPGILSWIIFFSQKHLWNPYSASRQSIYKRSCDLMSCKLVNI